MGWHTPPSPDRGTARHTEGDAPAMHVIIGGCGRVGAQLAERLAAGGHDVVVIDRSLGSFDRVGETFNGELVTGDVTDKDALLRAGIERADGFAAVTELDNANLMAVEVARTIFGVERTVARLFNPEREDSYRKMGVHYVSGTRLVAKALLNELQTEAFPLHVSFPDGELEVVEMRVRRAGHGVTIAEFEKGGDVRTAAIQRGARSILPKADDRLQEGDLVVAALRLRAVRRLHEWVDDPYATPAR